MIEANILENTSISLGKITEVGTMICILICDDDPTMLKKNYESIQTIVNKRKLKAKIYRFEDASIISDHILSSCDIAFLDIDFESENYNGLDIARRLRKFRNDSIIMFVTNFIEYAPEGYEVHAFRYILKSKFESDIEPYFEQAINQIFQQKKTVKIQVNGEIIDLHLDSILYFEVQQHNVTAYIQKNPLRKEIKAYTFYGSLSTLESRLESQGFLRIHKSFLVNMRHIKKFQCREAVLDNGINLRVGEKGYAENKRKYLIWKGWQ